MENRKELIKKFRNQVKNGKYASHETLLAYAFLRNIPYVVLERKINEDHENYNSIGKFCNARCSYLYYTLAPEVARKITETHFHKITAIAMEPSVLSKKLCSRLPLSLRA
jgi:hypothetical protein